MPHDKFDFHEQYWLWSTLAVGPCPQMLSARTAIEFTFPGAIGTSYRIEDSPDMNTWSLVESRIAGNGSVIQRFYSTRNMARRYFRVSVE